MFVTLKSFPELFIKSFCSCIEEKQIVNIIKQIRRNQIYLWQIPFKHGGLFLEGKRAKETFDFLDKSEAVDFIFDGSLSSKEAGPFDDSMSSKDIDKTGYVEYYIIGPEWSWCYVVTHEQYFCGPFLFFNSNHK